MKDCRRYVYDVLYNDARFFPMPVIVEDLEKYI